MSLVHLSNRRSDGFVGREAWLETAGFPFFLSHLIVLHFIHFINLHSFHSLCSPTQTIVDPLFLNVWCQDVSISLPFVRHGPSRSRSVWSQRNSDSGVELGGR